MTSINTNTAAISALSSLRQTDNSLNGIQDRISTGYRVAKAADNASYWSIGTTMKSDDKAMAAVGDSLSIADALVDTAYTGTKAVIGYVNEIKARLVSAREPGVDRDKVGKEITELKSQIVSTIKSSSFNGQNWLYDGTSNTGPVTDNQLTAAFVRGANNVVGVGTLTVKAPINASGGAGMLISDRADFNGLLTLRKSVSQGDGFGGTTTKNYFLIRSQAGSAGNEVTLSNSTADVDVDGMVSAIDYYAETLTDYAADLGAAKSRIALQTKFNNDLRDAVHIGVGKLIDADMDSESAKLKATQTQKQLGIQALSIANSAGDSVLSLFR
ncbi:flagellin N-terminal helical domain-containing protein [Allorhizobium terrae]|uniref:Flagellin n=1 Tax=Allorhizobium terrae TaxID=1848972 RepID=A0A4S4A4Y3_9HYPH|nr:flagellin [Allorhizobium terrae]THF53570.1 flagellin [Allorhizobium terrae]TWD54116.1 flagellin [Agrobacterium vitis]